jgi:putative SOS response-associated peptidase YedK
MQPIHERMPVIIPPEQYGLWLDQGMGDDRMTLYRWDQEEDWVEIGEYESAQIEDLVKAIREQMPG